MAGVRAFAVTAGFAWAALACGCGGNTRVAHPERSGRFAALDGQRYLWVEADCADGDLDLARLGFERELHVVARGDGLLLTFDTEIATTGCSVTSVVQLTPADGSDLFRIEPQAIVPMPPDGDCGASEREPSFGSVRAAGEVFELVWQRSPWCRGFDARFVYRRTDPVRLDAHDLVSRYVAHWNRGDAAAIAELFVDDGSLVEPFTRTEDGNYARHDGRERVRAWYERAFASSSWQALRLLAVTSGTLPGQVTADWEYMDPRLSAPLSGRNLFVIAGGEIYETEIQLVSDPEPRGDPAASEPAP